MTDSIAVPDHPHKSESGSQCSNPACRFGYFGLIEILKAVYSEIRDEDYHLGISF
jgi:hypothetical protein